MSQSHRIAAGADSATPRDQVQTIEQIEAHAAAVLAAEQEALRLLACCLRELAVGLPADSRLPVQLAKAAKSADLFSTAGSYPDGGLHEIEQVITEWNRDRLENWYEAAGRYLGRL